MTQILPIMGGFYTNVAPMMVAMAHKNDLSSQSLNFSNFLVSYMKAKANTFQLWIFGSLPMSISGLKFGQEAGIWCKKLQNLVRVKFTTGVSMACIFIIFYQK